MTSLYYLVTRYYDPSIGRFISPDDISYLDPSSVGGLNLYDYCGSNPIMRWDPTGCSWESFCQGVWDWGNTIAGLLNPKSKITAVGAVVVAIFQGRWSDLAHDWNSGALNPFNQNENVALNSKVLSFYKGSTVVRENFLGTCSIFGTIWLNSGESATTLKHEYGHFIQERFLGSAYYFFIAAPSVVNYYRSRAKLLKRDYYSYPWERTADWLSGVDRAGTGYIYTKGSLAWGIAYLFCSVIILPLYLIFN